MAILYVAGVSLCDNPRDLSPKTVKVLEKSDVLIGEERKTVHRILSTLENSEKDYHLLNEHSTDADRKEVLAEVKRVEIAVMFSDAGTPAISDPDSKFIAMCRESGVEVRSLAGPSSITTALSVSGIDCTSFFFAGFPPREQKKRDEFFQSLEVCKHATVFMERPYALTATLSQMSFITKKIAISINLGYEDEVNDFDYPKNLLAKYEGKKAPFIITVPKREKAERK